MRIVPATIIVLSGGLGACAGAQAPPCECPPPPPAPPATAPVVDAPVAPQPAAALTIPPFVLPALQGPHAQRVKLYINRDGSIGKYSVYVDRAGIPDWVHAMADQELGQGEDVEFEVEQYENGDTVYEVTREVDGKQIELAARSVDRTKLYIERKDLSPESAPPAVTKAATSVAGFVAKSHDVTQWADRTLHELNGELDGRPYTLYITPEGTIQHRRSPLAAELSIAR